MRRHHSYVSLLKCIVCGREYPAVDRLACDICGPVEGICDVLYDYEGVRRKMTKKALLSRPQDHWRYRELLPLHPDFPKNWDRSGCVNLRVGWTPICVTRRLGDYLGCGSLHIKDEGCNPTASFKDRASSVGVLKALEFGRSVIACASTGNAASSLAGFAAASGLPSRIFVPFHAPEPKLTQLLIYGAQVIRIRGSYEQAYDLCMQACARYGWYNRNCAVNCYLIEGKKTCGLEIGEQMADHPPDWVAVSVGDGCTIAGIWKGLKEMHLLGFLPRLPRLLGVQAEGAPAVARQFEKKEDDAFIPAPAATLADSICVSVPRNWRKAVRAVRESGGQFITVSDKAIIEALKYVPRLTGVFGEPAAVAAIAGIAAAREKGILGSNDMILAVVTGNGLKDVKTASTAAGAPHDIEPTIEALEAVIMNRKTL